jgi:membrane fusion protein, hemolysin D
MERKLIPFPSGFAQRRRRQEREFLPAALEIIDTPVSPAGRIMMAVVVVLVIAAVVWAYIGQLDIVATATGRLIPSGQIKVIQPLESGVIKQILVTDGDHVGAGDVLIELDTTAEAADRDRIARDIVQAQLDIARLRAALLGDIGAFAPAEGVDPALADAERRQLAAQIAQHRAKTDGLEQQIAAKTADRDEAKAKIAKIDASLPLLEAKVGIYEQLRQNQLTSKIAWLDSERQLSEAKHDRVVALYQLQGSEAQIASLGQQRQEVEADFRRQTLDQLAKVTQYAAEQQKELIKAARRTGLQEIRAPVSGTVEQLAVHTIGGVVRPAQSLMVVVPDDSKLELEAMLPNRDAGFVHAGQPAELKVEAFNYTRYGLLHGTVRRISRDALRDERDAPNLDENEPANSSPAQHSRVQAPAYIARIALAESAVETEQGSIPLEPGMTVTAEIKTGQRPVIAYLLSPFTRYRHDALKER